MAWDHADAEPPGDHDEPALVGTPVVVRRHAGVAALIGMAASAVAIAYLWRASQTVDFLDWALCGLMALVAAVYLAALVDARTPLLVADDLGVRIRLGDEWRGLPWEAIGQVAVHPRRGLLRDGRLVFAPRSLPRALDGVQGRARRHVALNQRMYGAPLAVPLGLTTRVTGPRERTDLRSQVAALAGGRADVVELDPRTLEVVEPGRPAGDEGHHGELAGAGRAAPDRSAPDRSAPDRGDAAYDEARAGLRPGGEPARTAPALLRETRRGARAEATLATAGATALALSGSEDGRRSGLPEGRELRRPDSVDLEREAVALDDRVRPISTMGQPVSPIVIDDFAVEPAYDPVIGPDLAAARTRLGLSVDELAERTRIRPHVIECIEVDDFGPCGGDFYARGHLRTLARILGKDAGPILDLFEERYASAPVNARRVFEAELATGMTGSMRSTTRGPSWSLLVGVVLVLALVWGVVRLLSAEPVELVEVPAPVLGGAPVAGAPAPGDRGPGSEASLVEPVNVRLSASQSDSAVVVRDGDQKVVFSGELVLGERRTLRVDPPVTVRAADGGAVEVRVAGRDVGFLGTAGEPARRTFDAPAAPTG
jgi:cytoskeletal protein RodZ